MIRILFFATNRPYPIRSGYDMHTYNICKHLAKRGNKVFLVYFNRKGEHLTADGDMLNTVIEETLVEYPKFYDQIYGKLYRIFLSLYPLSRIPFKPRGISKLQENLEKFIVAHNIDIIHAHGLTNNIFLINFHKVPKLTDPADSTSLTFKREMLEEECIVKKIHNYLLYNWSKRIEKTVLRDSQITTVVSPVDRAMLKSSYRNARVDVMPTGLAINYFSPKAGENEEYPTILFHGNMDFPPNIRAVKYIYDEILPIIRAQIPETKFLIAGRDPGEEIKKLGNEKGVIVTGYVEDIREYISKASVVIAPMKSGSGLKNKILEAMAMEKTVVTNPLGAEALSEEVKKCLLIGETVEEIANHVINLLRDREKRIELGKKGREIIMKEYTWDSVAEKYEKVYIELLKRSYTGEQK